MSSDVRRPGFNPGIWVCALGYFACYVPYSALTKALSDGLLAGMSGKISGFALLPTTTTASFLGMLVFLWVTDLYRFATPWKVGRFTIPGVGLWTFLSGLCTAAIIATTTLAYTFSGVSIVLIMLLLRGGVLILAPLVDFLTGRRPRWFSWAALALSLSALLVTFLEPILRGKPPSFNLTFVAAVDVLVYLASYFVRLRMMSRLAKSDDTNAGFRYFVEEQLVATPASVTFLVTLALIGQGRVMLEVREGFHMMLASPYVPYMVLIGVLSQGTGVFGGLILLDKRENTFCVPVNRASSMLAGVLATLSLSLLLGTKLPKSIEFVSAGLIIAAILVLSITPAIEKSRARRAR